MAGRGSGWQWHDIQLARCWAPAPALASINTAVRSPVGLLLRPSDGCSVGWTIERARAGSGELQGVAWLGAELCGALCRQPSGRQTLSISLRAQSLGLVQLEQAGA